MPTPPDDGPSLIRTTKAIAVADVVESVRLMEQDEQEFIRRWQRFVGFVQQTLPAESGRLHKSLGDGLMLEFSDAGGCVRAALAMREWFTTANHGLAPEDQVQLRIGAHMAEFVTDAYDIYGTDVNVAARIASLAGPGEIVITEALREHLPASLRDGLEDLGTCHLKHVKEPVRAYRVWQEGRAPALPLRRLASHTLRPTLAVLPFGMKGETPGELTGEALADDIVAALSRSEQLQVASRLSTAAFRDGRADIREVRRVVGAHYVLTGRARRHGDELALYAELADAVTGHVAWAQRFEGPVRGRSLGDGLLMREIVSALHSAVVAHEVERVREQPLRSMEGASLLLAAIGLMHRLATEDLESARVMLEHLVERGRGHASPHAWLAHLHVLRLRQGDVAGGGADAAAARDHAAQAVQCDSGSALALSMEGQACLHAGADFDSAEERYAQALTARPGDSLALLLQAELRALQGEGEAALHAAQRACETIPLETLRFLYDSVCAFAAFAAGDAALALPLAQRAVERSPRYLPALATLVAAQVRAGRLADARRNVQRWARRQPGLHVEAVLVAVPARDGVRQLLADALLDAGVPAAAGGATSAPAASS